MTYRDWIDAITACTTDEQAKCFVQQATETLLRANPDMLPEQARRIVMDNIGYLTGYLDRAQAGRLLSLFNTRHPYLGAIEDWPDDPAETIRMGYKLATQIAEGKNVEGVRSCRS